MSHDLLLASFGTSGNLSPLLTAGRLLRRRGHGIRVMADPAMRPEVEAAGFPFAPWRRAPVGRDADPSDFSNPVEWLQRAVFGPAPAYAADVLEEIARQPTDALICIDMLIGVGLAAERAGLPVALLSPHISLRPLPGLPPASSGLAQPATLQERQEAEAAAAQFAALLNGFLPDLNRLRGRLGLPDLAEVMDLFDRADRVLLAISRAFDFEADGLPDNMAYVGPLLDEPGWSRPWRSPWPADSRRPRALIACSTGAQEQTGLMQRVMGAVGTLEIDAVATAGPNVAVEALQAPENVRLLHSAPHDAVMKEVAIVVTQGGHGTVSRALVHGLPLLVLPNGRDQGDNAARVVAKGAGLRLPPDAPEPEIAAAVTRLLTEPGFRAAARRLGAAIRTDIRTSPLVREIETMLSGRQAARTRPQRPAA
ncbi:glycosyltransferase [Methylobacterium oryzisoli]|uniref:glycosyltransferase n=1 Tax=Methylobacterium oryzisoli TaxID=3385502 RepID=UPI0038927EAF